MDTRWPWEKGVLHFTDTCLLPFDGDGVLSEAQKERLREAKETLKTRYPDIKLINVTDDDHLDAAAGVGNDEGGEDTVVEDDTGLEASGVGDDAEPTPVDSDDVEEAEEAEEVEEEEEEAAA